MLRFPRLRRSRPASSRPAIAAAIESLESRVLLSTYYVATNGSNTNDGSSGAPWLTIQKGLNSVAAGDTLIVRNGTYNITTRLDTVAPGNAANRIHIKAENPRGALIQGSGAISLFNIDQQYYTIEGFIMDGAWASEDLITPTNNADFLIFKNNELRQGSKDGMDITGPTDVLIEDNLIHDFLWWDTVNNVRKDAHGIVTNAAVRLTMRNNEIYYVSGDAFQGIQGTWDDILIEGNNWWNGALPTNRNGFLAGANPGENAIDTKVDPTSARASLIIRDNTFHGWKSTLITNSAAMVLKQKIEAEVYNNVFYDNHIAWRYRGAVGDNGAWITSYNNILYNNDKALRYEDAINNMKIYNNTFGVGNATMFQGVNGTPTNYDVKNNLFRASGKPSIAGDASNKAVAATVFVDSANHDYHLVAGSTPIDGGVTVALVTTDFDGVSRPQGSAYDAGAYEYVSSGLPAVTMTANDTTATEAGQTTGQFTATRSGATTAALVVNYTIGGTAANTTDYSTLSGTVTIPIGAASATITITPVDDNLIESNETVILTLASGTGYTIGSPSNGTVTITSDDVPSITIAATDATATENPSTTGTFTVTRGGSGPALTTGALVVNYSISGTATNGSDYTTLSGSATIPDGQASATITVAPLDDSNAEGDETVILTISSGTGYTIGNPNSAAVTIADDDAGVTGQRIVFNRSQAQASWTSAFWTDVWSQVNRTPLSVDDVYVGAVTIDTRFSGANIAPAVVNRLEVGWRYDFDGPSFGNPEGADTGNLVIEADATDTPLTVLTDLTVGGNSSTSAGTVDQNAGNVIVNGNLKFSGLFGSPGAHTYTLDGGTLDVGNNFYIGLVPGDTDFSNAGGPAGLFTLASGTTFHVAGHMLANRGNSLQRVITVNSGATFDIDGNMQTGGTITFNHGGTTIIGGHAELARGSSKTTTWNVTAGTVDIGGTLDLNRTGTAILNLSGGVITANDLIIKTHTINKVDITSTGILRLVQGNYTIAEANNDISLARITASGGGTLTVGTVNIGGVNYTEIKVV